jgi:hypothetical protein
MRQMRTVQFGCYRMMGRSSILGADDVDTGPRGDDDAEDPQV